MLLVLFSTKLFSQPIQRNNWTPEQCSYFFANAIKSSNFSDIEQLIDPFGSTPKQIAEIAKLSRIQEYKVNTTKDYFNGFRVVKVEKAPEPKIMLVHCESYPKGKVVFFILAFIKRENGSFYLTDSEKYF